MKGKNFLESETMCKSRMEKYLNPEFVTRRANTSPFRKIKRGTISKQVITWEGSILSHHEKSGFLPAAAGQTGWH